MKLEEEDTDGSSSKSDDEDKLTSSSSSLELKSSSKENEGRDEALFTEIEDEYGELLMMLPKVATKARMTAPHLQKLKAMETDWRPLKEVVAIFEGIKLAVKVFEEFPELGVSWNTVSHNIVLHCLCQLGKMKEAYNLLVQMEHKGSFPDVVSYGVVVVGVSLKEVMCSVLFLRWNIITSFFYVMLLWLGFFFNWVSLLFS